GSAVAARTAGRAPCTPGGRPPLRAEPRRGEAPARRPRRGSLDERPQHAMGAERAEATEERVDRPRPLREPALPLGVMQPHLLAELLAEGLLLGEEELELEQVPEPHRLVPELGGRGGDAVPGR